MTASLAAALGAALCAFVLLLLVLGPLQPRDREHADMTERVDFIVKRGEHLARASAGVQVAPGDQVRFIYNASQPRYLAILSVDAAQHVRVYFPAGRLAQRVRAGSQVALPPAELDHVPERVLGLFCDSPIPLDAVSDLLARDPAGFVAPTGCTAKELLVQ